VNRKMLLTIATRLRRITEQDGVSNFELLSTAQTIRDIVREEKEDVLIEKTKNA